MNLKRFSQLLAIVIAGLLPLYYFRLTLGPIPTNLIEILILLLLVATVWSARRLVLPYWQPILIIGVGVAIASVTALDQRVAWGIVKGWFVLPIIYYSCLATLFTGSERTQLVRPLTISVFLVSVYALGQWLGVIGLLAHQGAAAQQYVDQGRAIGFFESPNFLAMYLAPLTLLTGGYLYLSKQYRDLSWLILPVIVIGLSQSLGGWLALLAGAGFVWLTLGERRPKLIWLTFCLVGAIFLALNSLTDNSQRLLIWENALKIIGQHSLLGIGPGQFPAQFAALNDGSVLFSSTLPYALHPHNIFLNFWLSAGIAGLIGFTKLLVQVFRSGVASPLAIGALAGLVAIIVHGLFDSTYFKNDLAIIFWLLVFLLSQNEPQAA